MIEENSLVYRCRFSFNIRTRKFSFYVRTRININIRTTISSQINSGVYRRRTSSRVAGRGLKRIGLRNNGYGSNERSIVNKR